jgi:hypothetical protein
VIKIVKNSSNVLNAQISIPLIPRGSLVLWFIIFSDFEKELSLKRMDGGL